MVIVPDEVTGLPDTVSPVVPPDRATLVTVPLPVPAPIAERNVAASKVDTVLSALNLGNVTALGLVSVKRLPPTVVAPRLVLAPEAEVDPVPPLIRGKAVDRLSALAVSVVPLNVRFVDPAALPAEL
jgi:hypothetical protein